MDARNELLSVGLLATLISGCTAGPNYKKPAVPAPAVYRGGSPQQQIPPAVASFGEQKWWDAFQDDALRDLIRAAVEQNYDVRIAAARIVEARALLGITRADQLPEVSAGLSAVNQRLPQSPGRPPIETSATQVSVSAAWELDFWGKFRRATESARARLLSEEWAQRQVVSSLVSDVAAAYFQLREQDLELEISRQTLASRKDSLGLTQVLADRGATSLLDVRQAEQLVFSAGASIADLEQRIEQQENFISILVGRNPDSVVRGRGLIDQPQPVEVPAGLPSSLLERRPDILQAEQQLVASNALIGAARALFFPRITLTGLFGFASGSLESLFTGPAHTWSFTGDVAGPIYTGGGLTAAVDQAEARRDQSFANYELVIQNAFRDVEDSLADLRHSAELRETAERRVDVLRRGLELANIRYENGYSDYLEVLDTERSLFSAELQLASARGDYDRALVSLYRALGGDWNAVPPVVATQKQAAAGR